MKIAVPEECPKFIACFKEGCNNMTYITCNIHSQASKSAWELLWNYIHQFGFYQVQTFTRNEANWLPSFVCCWIYRNYIGWEEETSFSKDTSKNIVEYHETQELQIVTGWVFVYIWLAAMTRPKNERYEKLMATGILRGGEHPKIYNKKERVNRSSQRFRRNGCHIVSMYHCFLRSAVCVTPASLGDFLRVIKINIKYILLSSILMLFV